LGNGGHILTMKGYQRTPDGGEIIFTADSLMNATGFEKRVLREVFSPRNVVFTPNDMYTEYPHSNKNFDVYTVTV